MQPRLYVVVAVIQNDRRQVLISQRAPEKHWGGLWEFPGGKREAGETVVGALHRELKEELGIRVCHCEPLLKVCHDDPGPPVLLDVWRITAFAGEVHGREHQPLKWVLPSELRGYRLPPANKAIIEHLLKGAAIRP